MKDARNQRMIECVYISGSRKQMKKTDYEKQAEEFFREKSAAWHRSIEEEEKFHAHYSSAGLGLMMTLQTIRKADGSEATGPTWLWISALVCFALCLLLSGWSYWWDAHHYHSYLVDYRKTGEFKKHPRFDAFLGYVNIAVRASFFLAIVSAAAFFICQRICRL